MWKNSKYDPDSPDAKYAEDVLGSCGNRKFEDNFRAALEIFSHLPDSHPAEVVEGIPDIICAGCAIGKHCRRLFNEGPSMNGKIHKKDERDMDSFLRNLDYLNLPKPIIISEEACFPDAESQIVRRVRTTIGVIRKVYREGNSPVFWDHNPTINCKKA